MNLKVLYEDNHLIAVEKPAGLLTQGDETGDVSLMDGVKKYLKEKYKKPGNVYLGLLHRLDRPVSGVILFAKTSKGASRLSAQFRNHEVKKIYHAIVSGRPKENKGFLANYLKKDREARKTIVSKEQILGSQKAELFYEIVASNDKYALLKIQPKTGRFHQIRAQLAAAGHPILGDLKYGPPRRARSSGEAGPPAALPDKSIALAATEISFRLATKDERKTISILIPADWKKYV